MSLKKTDFVYGSSRKVLKNRVWFTKFEDYSWAVTLLEEFGLSLKSHRHRRGTQRGTPHGYQQHPSGKDPPTS